MPEDTRARRAYVHMALRTAAGYTAAARVPRVGVPPAYVDIPGVYEVDPDFQDTQQTTGELALLGIVASLAKKDVTIRKLKRKIELLEDIIERGEIEEVEDLCGVDEGSAVERSDIEEFWEEESSEATSSSPEAESESPSSSSEGDPQSPSPSETQKQATRSRTTRPGRIGEQRYRSHEGSPDAEEEDEQPGPSSRANRKSGRAGYQKMIRMKRTTRGDTPYPSVVGEGSSSRSDGTRTPRDPTSVPAGETRAFDRA